MGEYMLLDELMFRLSMGRGSSPGQPYIVSWPTYQAMERAIDHYLETGDIVKGEYGLERRDPVASATRHGPWGLASTLC